jgi:hypothetical protein
VNALVGFRLKRLRSFFALGFGVERWNCYETGMTWHAKVYLGPWVLLIDPRKSNAPLQVLERSDNNLQAEVRR